MFIHKKISEILMVIGLAILAAVVLWARLSHNTEPPMGLSKCERYAAENNGSKIGPCADSILEALRATQNAQPDDKTPFGIDPRSQKFRGLPQSPSPWWITRGRVEA